MSPSGWISVDENRAARRAVLRHIVAIKKSKPVPPVLIRGRDGSGKTRLAEEGLARLMEVAPGSSWRLLGPRDLLTSLKAPNSEQYEGRELVDVDWLILDDLEPFAAAMEERLCRILDQRQAQSRPTMVLSSQPLGKLATTTRLSGRLRGGILVELAAWRQKSRLIWLRKLFLQGQLDRPKNDLPILARKMPGLPGPMSVYCQSLKRTASKGAIPADPTKPTTERILDAVAREFGVPLRQIRGKSRAKKINEARQAAMHLLRKVLDLPLESIGHALGGRDHKTILSGLARVKQRQRTDKVFSQLVKSSQDLI